MGIHRAVKTPVFNDLMKVNNSYGGFTLDPLNDVGQK
jgi:hypothetical protein